LIVRRAQIACRSDVASRTGAGTPRQESTIHRRGVAVAVGDVRAAEEYVPDSVVVGIRYHYVFIWQSSNTSRIQEASVCPWPIRGSRYAHLPGECGYYSCCGNVPNDMAVEIPHNHIPIRQRRDTAGSIEAGGGPGPIHGSECALQPRQCAHHSSGRNDPDGMTIGIRHQYVSIWQSSDSVGSIEASGGPGPICGSGCTLQPRQCCHYSRHRNVPD
jgi:hypothetical protein